MNKEEIAQYIQKARELISDPQHWTKNSAARDAQGRPCLPRNEDATCWCLLGSLYKVTPNHEIYESVFRSVFETYCDTMKSEPTYEGALADFNDKEGTTHEMALSLLDNALKAHE